MQLELSFLQQADAYLLGHCHDVLKERLRIGYIQALLLDVTIMNLNSFPSWAIVLASVRTVPPPS